MFEEQQSVRETSGLLEHKDGRRPIMGAGVQRSSPRVLQLWEPLKDLKYHLRSGIQCGSIFPHQVALLCPTSFPVSPTSPLFSCRGHTLWDLIIVCLVSTCPLVVKSSPLISHLAECFVTTQPMPSTPQENLC